MVAALISAAFAARRLPRLKADRQAPNPRLVGVVAFIVSSLFFALGENWPGVAIKIVLIVIMAAVATQWSDHAGWGARHRLALAGGGTLLIYA